jgi:hypothetical protein
MSYYSATSCIISPLSTVCKASSFRSIEKANFSFHSTCLWKMLLCYEKLVNFHRENKLQMHLCNCSQHQKHIDAAKNWCLHKVYTMKM